MRFRVLATTLVFFLTICGGVDVVNGQTNTPVKVLIFGPPAWEGRGGLENVLDQLGVVPGYLTYEFVGDNIPNFWESLGEEIHISEAVNLSTLLNYDVLVIDDWESNRIAQRVFYNQQDKELLKEYLNNGGRIISWYQIYLQGSRGPVDLTLSELFGYSSLDVSKRTHEISITSETPQWPYSISNWTMVRAYNRQWIYTTMVKMIPNQATVWAVNADPADPFPTIIATHNTVLFGEAFSCNFEHIDGPRDDDPRVTISEYGLARLFINALLFRGQIPATIDIDPDTLNLKAKGVFTAYITLPEGYSVEDINVTTLECEGAQAVKSSIEEGMLVAKFNREDLIDIEPDDKVTLTVTGLLNDGTPFEGSDTIRVVSKEK
jgi:hypothetical protein